MVEVLVTGARSPDRMALDSQDLQRVADEVRRLRMAIEDGSDVSDQLHEIHHVLQDIRDQMQTGQSD